MDRLRGIAPYLLVFAVLAVCAGSSFAAGPPGKEADRSREAFPVREAATPTRLTGGIREVIPARFRSRYESWKAELLATAHGRAQWEKYANSSEFALTIRMTRDRKRGASTDGFKWDGSGRFVGATITLGADLDSGFPSPIYYPVLNSLSPGGSAYSISGRILAAAKISHEFGHVNQVADVGMEVMLLQERLVPVYVSIFLNNGLNTNDEKLIELADQMGGTPLEIWESREYWSEVNAMLYLQERIGSENYYCDVLGKIRRNLFTYANAYGRRFEDVTEISASPCWNPNGRVNAQVRSYAQ